MVSKDTSSRSQPVLSPKSDTATHHARGWRDIASAPRDGTSILVAHLKTGAIFAVQWDTWAEGWVDGALDNEGDLITYAPSHWMPTPPPPEIDADDGAASRHEGGLRDEPSSPPSPTREAVEEAKDLLSDFTSLNAPAYHALGTLLTALQDREEEIARREEDRFERVKEKITLQSALAEALGAWDWLSTRINLELSWGDHPDAAEGDPCVWMVYRVSGSRNDREWEFIAASETALGAVTDARTRLTNGEGGGA